jgi:hypothetical protein
MDIILIFQYFRINMSNFMVLRNYVTYQYAQSISNKCSQYHINLSLTDISTTYSNGWLCLHLQVCILHIYIYI